MPKPNPKPAKFHVKDVKGMLESKRLDCVSYGECLDSAAIKNWKGFSCLDCKAYISDPLRFSKPEASSIFSFQEKHLW